MTDPVVPERTVRRVPQRRSDVDDRPSLRRRLADPVVVILFLAGFFDGLAGNPIHGLVLWGAVAVILWRPVTESERNSEPDGRPLWELQATGIRPRWLPVAILTTAAYATVVGGLERYTWPVTIAVIIPGTIALLIAGSTPHGTGPEPDVDGTGAALWIVLFVVIAVFELVNFVLQPDRLTASYDHPTLSTLFNTYITGHAGQSLALLVWMVTGWWLVER